MTSIEDLERAIATALASNRFKVPPYPAVAAKLESLARQRNGATINQLVAVISADACLAAQVLGRAQSAANSNGRAVTTLFEALSRVGLDTLVQMALATGLGSEVIAPGPLAELRRDMWRRGLLSAHLARMLANNRGVSEETAYSAGLIHDLGSAIVVTTLEDLAKQLPLPVLPEASWRQLVHNHQVAFGMVIASRWKLPDTLTELIAHGHDQTSQSPLAQLIQLSDRIVARLDGTPTTGIAAMMDFPELSDIERCTIGSVVQEVVKNMASYNEVKATKTVPSNVAVERPANGLLPVAFEVTPEHKRRCRARAISSEALVLDGDDELLPNWLIELTLHCQPKPMTMLANVRSCERSGARYVISVQPFALGGTAKHQWQQLVDAAA